MFIMQFEYKINASLTQNDLLLYDEYTINYT